MLEYRRDGRGQTFHILDSIAAYLEEVSNLQRILILNNTRTL